MTSAWECMGCLRGGAWDVGVWARAWGCMGCLQGDDVVQSWAIRVGDDVVQSRAIRVHGSLEGVSNPIFDIRYTGWGGGVLGWWGSRVVG